MENSISPQEKMINNIGLILPKHDDQQIPQKPLQTHYPSPSCAVATGGLHGDLEKTMQAFRLGGLIDGSNYWFGVSTTVVQIGDVLEILYFLKMLKREAAKNGGQTDNFEWQS
ncbi:Calcineurin-like metallo-phosphoesterase superfamily protein [Gossypium australe]|uniref:Calcineurin-like metallo-phosphoesterase superfamily protein n=1 Tax=Gossypium australe TaxID=47621 RepID=A0A5B6WFK9_9ROSI|nr:Calcineurin-like metallo-phosphoesterase superfamily protein [Gossypium australe]